MSSNQSCLQSGIERIRALPGTIIEASPMTHRLDERRKCSGIASTTGGGDAGLGGDKLSLRVADARLEGKEGVMACKSRVRVRGRV